MDVHVFKRHEAAIFCCVCRGLDFDMRTIEKHRDASMKEYYYKFGQKKEKRDRKVGKEIKRIKKYEERGRRSIGQGR